MTFQYRIIFFAILIISLLFVLGCATGGGVLSGHSEGYKDADIVLGALLYDKWYTVKDVATSGNHPLYPTDGKKKGATTWRCKECHGWDYIGKDGRYSKGSHFTNIKGVYDTRLDNPEELYGVLSDTEMNHDFSQYLTESDLWAIVKFISEGLIDIKTVIDIEGAIKGNSEKGRPLYESNCSMCHEKDGGGIDFKKKDGVQGVGWLSNDNPQETLHKIRWGHPGSEMPSVVVDNRLSDSETVDILSFTQTLKY